MKLIHVVRNSPDWVNLEADYDAHQVSALVKDNMRKIFKNWRRYLKPDYCTFRSLIVDIAKNNHSKLGADIQFSTALDIQKNLAKIEDKYIVLFSDDDDWYHPDVFNFVIDSYTNNPNADAIMWNHCAFCNNFKQFQKQRTEPYFVLTNNLSFHTNNYALTDVFFRKFNTEDDIHQLNYGQDYDLYYGHNNIDLLFKDRMQFIKLEPCLSVANKSITSYSYWWENDVVDLIDVIDACSHFESLTIPKSVQWAAQEINETLALYKKIEFKAML